MASDTRFDRNRNFNSKIYVISGKMLLAAIVVLFTVVLFILGLHIYARYFWHRSLRVPRRLRVSSRRRRLAFTAGDDPARLHKVGLEKSMIETLPVFVYRAENHKDGALECAVCLCEFEDKEKARLLPNCNHNFHIDCIDMWFDSHSTCPLCRTSARPDPPQSRVDGGSVAVVVVGESSGATGEEQASAVSITVDGNREADVWHSQNRVTSPSSSNLGGGASPPKLMARNVVDIPARRPDGFSSPRDHQQQLLLSPGGSSSLKSPTTRLHSLRSIFNRSVPQSPDREYSH